MDRSLRGIERLASQLAQAVDQQQTGQRDQLMAIREIAKIQSIALECVEPQKSFDQQLRRLVEVASSGEETAESSNSRTLEEYQRVVLFGGEPKLGTF